MPSVILTNAKAWLDGYDIAVIRVYESYDKDMPEYLLKSIGGNKAVVEAQLSELPAGVSLEEVFLAAIAKEGQLTEAAAEETLEEVGAGRSES